MSRHLLIMSCSDTKRPDPVPLPAVERYDGPFYRVLRSHLRTSLWPRDLSVAVLSAKYGLIGGLFSIEAYDQRMTLERARLISREATEVARRWAQEHASVHLVLGKDYLAALDTDALRAQGVEPTVAEGPIGRKLQHLSQLMKRLRGPRRPRPPRSLDRPLYFLPDWDDMVDEGYDFQADRFSARDRKDRKEIHISRATGVRSCDGILVSLAQRYGASPKGLLRVTDPTGVESLAPPSLREQFGLRDDQWIFGDCGAFSYVHKDEPTVTPEEAVSIYQLYGFDFGASVDHIPVREISTPRGKYRLGNEEQERRIRITQDNAARFLALHRQRRCTFIPVGVIQGTDARSYASQVSDYVAMGYEHVALGGLVPRRDEEIVEILRAVAVALGRRRGDVWIHLFGVYRPAIHRELRQLGVASFDSATYYRKAWLRSGQNYLAVNGRWYAAIRIPLSDDPRTRKKLDLCGVSWDEVRRLEAEALKAVREYAQRQRDLESTLAAIYAYDRLLARNEGDATTLLKRYRRTLADRPWEQCTCDVCRQLGVEVVLFRGYNRNKRRGAHNTAMLYRQVAGQGGEG